MNTGVLTGLRTPARSAVPHKVLIRKALGNISTTSNPFVPIHATDLRYLYFDLAVGDLVVLTLNLTWTVNNAPGFAPRFDFEIDNPRTANSYLSGDASGCSANEDGFVTGYPHALSLVSGFVAPEPGEYGFRPVMAVEGGATLNIINQSGSTTFNIPILFLIEKYGRAAA